MGSSEIHIFAPLMLPASYPRLLIAGRGVATDSGYHNAVSHRQTQYVTIQLTISGSGSIWTRGPHGPEEHEVDSGHLMLFIAGERQVSYGYPSDGTEPWSFEYVELGGTAAIDMAKSVIERRGRVLPLSPQRTFVRRTRRLMSQNADTLIRLPAQSSTSLACEWLAALVDTSSKATPQDDTLIQAACDWLIDNLHDGVGIAQAASALKVSREHLTRVFKRRIGQSPGAWLAHERILRGERLLRETSDTIAHIASACGIRDASHFAAMFRQKYGVAPARYRILLVDN